MSRFPLLRWLVGDAEEVLYECRNCGRTLDDDRATCPECESEHVVEYRL